MNMTSRKGIFAFIAALLLATLLGCAGTSKQESTGEYIDDSVITTRVKAAILEDASPKSAEIDVETFKGVASVKNDMRLK
jgi:osmotically-inducible protein OsmY